MTGADRIKLGSLEETLLFYKVELEKDLTEKQKDSYLVALEKVKEIIRQKELSRESISNMSKERK